MTRTESTTGVSRLPSRPRSLSTLATTPDEVTQVTPASTTAATQPQPSSSASAAPGSALSAASSNPIGAELEHLPAGVGGQKTAVPEREPGEQIEGDGREPEPAAEPTEQTEEEQQRADLDQQHGGLVHRRLSRPDRRWRGCGSARRALAGCRPRPPRRRSGSGSR